MNDAVTHRYVSIDLLRTVAIVLMVVYHLFFDLWYYYGVPINPNEYPIKTIGLYAGILFLIVSGMAAGIRFHGRAKEEIWHKAKKRAVRIGSAALLITLVTYWMDPETYIRFGILHCIAVSALLLPFFRSLGNINILIASTIVLGGFLLILTPLDTFLLVPLGFRYTGFRSLDYYPLAPWFGVILYGFLLGSKLYHPKLHTKTAAPKWIRILSIPGRYSLIIYLIHQPILLLLLALAKG